jgi:peptidoglycan/xylan/chitin deacetylase (PgdA/CDA1 family)
VLAVAQRALHASGASAAFTRVRPTKGGGALILSYHSVTSSAEVPFIDPRYALPVAEFQKQMEFLATHRRVLAMSDLVDRVRRRLPIPAGAVVITFDDGYLNTLRVAAPVLDRLGLPALVYLPTGQIERAQSQFIDVLHGTFALRTSNELHLPAAGLDRAELRGRRAVQRIYGLLADALSTMSLSARAEVLALLADQLKPSRPIPRLTMNWDDVVELSRKHRFDIGVHTRDHLDLTALDVEQTRAEVASCIADLHAATGKLPEHFAYPYGRCSTRVRDDVAATTLRSAAVTEPAGLVTHDADVFTLPRLLAPATMELFPFFTSGAYPESSKAILRRA